MLLIYYSGNVVVGGIDDVLWSTCLYVCFISTARHRSSVTVTSDRLFPTTTTPSLRTSVIQDSSIDAKVTLFPTTTASSLSTPVITHQEFSIANALPTTLPQPSSRGGNMQFTDGSFSATTFGIADALPTTLPQPSSRGGNMQFTDESFPAMTVGIATGVGGGFLLAMFIVLIVIAVFLLIWRRKRKYLNNNQENDREDDLLNNPLYGHQG